jgi:type I restriction enzyme S subunit
MKLQEVCELIVDCEHKTAPTQETGYPSIRTPNIGRGYFILDGVNRVSEETYRLWTRRARPQQGDLIMAREAPVGNVAIITAGLQPCLGQRTLLIRPDRSKVDPLFLNYFLNGSFVQGLIQAKTNGATVAHLNMEDVRTMELPELPRLSTQRRTAEILGTYDDLIANNARRIKVLEEMAKMIYREWFVNFRFPDHHKVRLTNSELGPVPEGWNVTSLGEIASVNQTTIKMKQPDDLISYVDIASVSTGQIDQKIRIPFGDAPGRARRVVRSGDIIWSTVRPNRKSFALILNPEPDLIVSTGFAVLTPTKVPFTYLYFSSTTDEFAEYLSNHATGAAYPAVNAADFERAKVLLPPELLLKRFHSLTANCLELQDCLQRRNSNLFTTRDILLPKLISGEIGVDHPETEPAAQIS